MFIPQAKTDIERFATIDPKLKEKWVKLLFDLDVVDHYLSKAYNVDAQFDTYYQVFEKNYFLVDMNHDKVPELIFSGRATQEVESEQLAIYAIHENKPTQLFLESGHFFAYLEQPNTKEILVYHHQYPCCENASHNINRLRLVAGKIQKLKRYFVGRDLPMKGSFFPRSSTNTLAFHYTKNDKMPLRWSPEVITENAWKGRSQANVIANYPASSTYKVMSKHGKWLFVLMQNAPMIEENRVINPANFNDTWIYGWLKTN